MPHGGGFDEGHAVVRNVLPVPFEDVSHDDQDALDPVERDDAKGGLGTMPFAKTQQQKPSILAASKKLTFLRQIGHCVCRVLLRSLE